MSGQKTPLQPEREIEKFVELCESLSHYGLQVDQPAPYVFRLESSTMRLDRAVGVQALNHGNEIGGLLVLNQLLEHIAQGLIQLPAPLYVGLGNVAAARKGLRFLECDLNRCYGGKGERLEERRAQELISAYRHVDLFLDLHQTQTPCRMPFFPITFTPRTFSVLVSLEPNAVVVPYAPTPLNDQGASLSRWLYHQGNCGITVELGTMGESSYQVAYGLHLVLRLLAIHANPMNTKPAFRGQAYRIKRTVGAPAERSWLRADMENFAQVRRGEVLGSSNAEPWIADDDGYIVFPKAIEGRSRTQANPGEPIFVLIEPVPIQQILDDPAFADLKKR